MTHEEFQKLVLEKLSSLENGQKEINTRLGKIEKKLDIVEEQTKTLSEFRHTVIESAKELTKKIS